jgi:hypothetical protein
MIDKRSFKKRFSGPLDLAGFVRRGQTWYVTGQDATIAVNLQKYDFAEEYFVNVGIWLRALGDRPFPSCNACHIVIRAERLFPEHREVILTACSLTDSDDQRLAQLSRFTTQELIPFCTSCFAEAFVRSEYNRGRFTQALVVREARVLFTPDRDLCPRLP